MLLKTLRHLVFISPLLYSTYFLRFQIAGIPFTFLEVFTYILFGLWIIGLIRDRKIVIWDKKTKYYSYAIFLLLIGAIIGVFMAPDFFSLPSGEILNAKRATLGIWKGWVFAPILYFVVLSQVLKTPKDVEKILRSYVYAAALIGIISIGFGIFGDGITDDIRLRGFFNSANYLALFIGPAILINACFLTKKHYDFKIVRHLDVVSLIILTFCLFFTKSYAGIISIFGALGLYILYYLIKHPKNRKKGIAILIVLTLTFSVVILSQLNSPKFKQSLDFKSRSSSSVRIEIYRTSFDLIKENPIFGIGPGLFQANYQIKAPITLGHAPLEWNMPHTHNIFLGFWLNAGLIGLTAFLLIIILCHTSFTYPLIALWAILAHGLFDMPFWKNDLAMIFWLIIACVLVLQKVKRESV